MRETIPARPYVLPALLAMLLCAGPASGALIEFTLEGTIVSGIGSDTPPWDFVEHGDTFQLQFIYERDTEGVQVSRERTNYLDVVQELSVTINGVSETADRGDIQIIHGLPIGDGEVVDRFVLDNAPLPSGWFVTMILAQPYFPKEEAGIFDGGMLPESLPLDVLGATSFGLIAPEGAGYIGRVMTSHARVVPCPWAGTLFAYLLLPSRRRTARVVALPFYKAG